MKYFILATTLSLLAAPRLVAAADSSNTTTPSTLSGCLNGPNEDGTFTLQRVNAGDVHVGGLETLKDHAGQEVRLHGNWVGSGKEIGEKESTTAKVGDTVKTRKNFRVAKVETLSDKCDVKH
jgi:hypothetical protein